MIDKLFESREHDPAGGEGGERVQRIKRKPVFKITSGRLRGATWFDTEHPPQGIVWLLGAEMHDERHKGGSDAYDVLGALDDRNELFPGELDYKLLELHRRLVDTESFADELARDADKLASAVQAQAAVNGTLADVPVRVVVQAEREVTLIYVAVSQKPVVGRLSGLPFELTQQRFELLIEGVRAAVERVVNAEALAAPLASRAEFPGGVRDERPFLVMV